jgi:hypothetical protein
MYAVTPSERVTNGDFRDELCNSTEYSVNAKFALTIEPPPTILKVKHSHVTQLFVWLTKWLCGSCTCGPSHFSHDYVGLWAVRLWGTASYRPAATSA